MSPTIIVIQADLSRAAHAADVVALTAAYARDPMGNRGPLAAEVLGRLVAGLRATPTALVFLAYVDEAPAGIATCFRGFSTFQARPLINVHDLAVMPAYRGAGVGRALLDAVAEKAEAIGCCKVTLEVQAGNLSARRIYEAAGFAHALATAPGGGMLFYAKPIGPR